MEGDYPEPIQFADPELEPFTDEEDDYKQGQYRTDPKPLMDNQDGGVDGHDDSELKKSSVDHLPRDFSEGKLFVGGVSWKTLQVKEQRKRKRSDEKPSYVDEDCSFDEVKEQRKRKQSDEKPSYVDEDCSFDEGKEQRKRSDKKPSYLDEDFIFCEGSMENEEVTIKKGDLERFNEIFLSGCDQMENVMSQTMEAAKNFMSQILNKSAKN